MKLNAALILLLTATSTFAQAEAQTTAAKRAAARRTTTTVRKPAATCEDLPTLGAAIPKVEACPKALYSLRYVDTLVGTGTPVTSRKWLTVNYTGYLTDGTKFDTSVGKDPITFPYGARQVIAGWDTGFDGMSIGGKRRLYIPYELAYGETGRPPTIPAKATLVFDVELLAISDTPPAPKAPPAPPRRRYPPHHRPPIHQARRRPHQAYRDPPHYGTPHRNSEASAVT